MKSILIVLGVVIGVAAAGIAGFAFLGDLSAPADQIVIQVNVDES